MSSAVTAFGQLLELYLRLVQLRLRGLELDLIPVSDQVRQGLAGSDRIARSVAGRVGGNRDGAAVGYGLRRYERRGHQHAQNERAQRRQRRHD